MDYSDLDPEGMDELENEATNRDMDEMMQDMYDSQTKIEDDFESMRRWNEEIGDYEFIDFYDGVFGVIPEVSVIDNETFINSIKIPLEARAHRWRNFVGKIIDEYWLEKLFKTNSKAFQSFFLESTIIAMRNYRGFKIQAIANLVLNSMKQQDYNNYDNNKLFLNHIDQLTADHLKTLFKIHINSLEKAKGFREERRYQRIDQLHNSIIRNVFNGDKGLFSVVIFDLMTIKEFITLEDPLSHKSGNNYELTSLGKQFSKLVFYDRKTLKFDI